MRSKGRKRRVAGEKEAKRGKEVEKMELEGEGEESKEGDLERWKTR